MTEQSGLQKVIEHEPLTRTEQKIMQATPLGLPTDAEIIRVKSIVDTLDGYAVDALKTLKQISDCEEQKDDGSPVVKPETRVNAASKILTAGADYIGRRYQMLGVTKTEEKRSVMTFSNENVIAHAKVEVTE